MAKRTNYPDKFRASAVVMLEAAGYPADRSHLERIAKQLRIPARTLRRWFNRQHNPPPDDVVQESKRELIDILEDVARKYLTHALSEDVIDEATGNAAVTAAAIAIDKMRLLQGQSTGNMSVTINDAREKLASLLTSRPDSSGAERDTEYTQ